MENEMNGSAVSQKVVTRFAPSPTGFMHIGGIRTALFAFLWARKNMGQFILRIEDTDKDREVIGSIEHIQEALSWLGINWDLGPDKPGPFGSCIQSERLETYKEFAQKLIAKGLAYPDPFTQAELETLRKEAEENKQPFLYRNHRPDKFGVWDGTKPLRFKVPEVKRYHWHDAVRGDLEAGEEALDDFVLIKSDGYPTYNFAHIVDDFVMGVTHIFRGDEFISSTPRFLSLYEALEIKPPVFVTLPPILREDHTKKLGKRDGAKDVLEYRNEGYLPEALTNILALIGWNPGTDRELFTLDELIKNFSIEKVQRAGGSFNDVKLAWFNHQYIAKLSPDDFAERSSTFLPEWLSSTSPLFSRCIPVIIERLNKISDVSSMFEQGGELHFVKELSAYKPESLLWKKEPSVESAIMHLKKCAELISSLGEAGFNTVGIHNTLIAYAETVGKGNVLWPLRMALTGQERSPDPFVSAFILGKEESLRRIQYAIDKLSKK